MWNFCGVYQVNDVGGERWQSEQSCGTAGVVVGAPFFQITASCFISGEAGVRAVSVAPTNPLGMDVAWQSRHVAGCARLSAVIDACNWPGKKTPAFALAWQDTQAVDGGTAVLLWNIGIGSVSSSAFAPACLPTDSHPE
mgnify:CR=1 FL=1